MYVYLITRTRPTNYYFFPSMAQQPLVLHGRPITEASGSRSHHIQLDSSERVISPTKRSLDNTQHAQEIRIHTPVGILTRNPSERPQIHALTPRGQWDRHPYRV